MTEPASRPPANWYQHTQRYFYIALGWVFFAIGFIGVFVPLLPTTVFMLLALWAFSRGSKRLHDYLWQHPRFGPAVRDWYLYRMVPRRAKVAAVSLMSLSSVFLVFVFNVPLWGVIPAVLTMVGVGVWLWSRPENRPEDNR